VAKVTTESVPARPDRTVWHAAITGAWIALGLTVLGIVAYFSVDNSPAPSGYAGAAYGAVIVYALIAALMAALVIGLLAGGILYRRRRSWMFTWGVMVVILGVLFGGVSWMMS
jgi:hypothetical protein